MKGENPLVNVIIGTCNRAEIMPRAVNSVLKQSYKEVEVILVDDASIDNTPDVVSSFTDKRVRYIRHDKNKKIAAVSNTGFKHSNGELIALLGDDDEWIDKDKLRKQISIYKEKKDSNIGIVCTWWQHIDNGVVLTKHTPVAPPNWVERILISNSIICGSTPLIPRHVLESVGGFDEKMKRGVDSDLFRRIIIKGYDVVIIPEIMVNVYTDSPNRITPVNTFEENVKCLKSVQYVLEKFSNTFDKYPRAKAARYYQMARYAYSAYVLSKDSYYFRESESYLKEGLKNKIAMKPAILAMAIHFPGFKSYYRKKLEYNFVTSAED
ncbi:MAG: glycosyltransferase family 2 protein [Candidatus Hodarchaeota archaeon]